MVPIDEFEAAHMTDEQLIHELWTKEYTYEDYCTQCEILKRGAVSKEVFRSLYKRFDTKMAMNISQRTANPVDERRYFERLHLNIPTFSRL